jgi:S-adenosylmethionine synthetase
MRTAEFVSPKHPDKMCDRISDTLLDKFLEQDPNSRCAIETMGGHGKVWITGEVTSKGNLSDDEIIQVVKDISGVEDVTIHLSKQSPEIAQGVDVGGAGDQGIMIGYACSETSTMMPFEYELARSLNKHIYQYYPFDGKTQVTINGSDARVVASFQNSKSQHLKELIFDFFKNQKISTMDFNVTQTLCNPAGEWKVGGFDSDAGLTGRKLAVDSYGPRIPIGGGAFSGKDATKVDRSAAYMARKIAVDTVKKYNLSYAMVELSYAIGCEQPVQAYIKGNEHGINTETGLWLRPVSGYDLSPKGIIDYLDLKKPIFSQTSQWGHFGNDFNWG